MFEISSLCVNTRLHGSVANALLQNTPDVNQSLLEFIDIVDPCLIDTLLYNSTNLVVKEVQVMAVGGHSSREMKLNAVVILLAYDH